jgi:16S rRNA (guanine527-N7)-methyltransferase
MKGRVPEDELKALPAGWKALVVHPIRVPGLDAERCLVELARV